MKKPVRFESDVIFDFRPSDLLLYSQTLVCVAYILFVVASNLTPFLHVAWMAQIHVWFLFYVVATALPVFFRPSRSAQYIDSLTEPRIFNLWHRNASKDILDHVPPGTILVLPNLLDSKARSGALFSQIYVPYLINNPPCFRFNYFAARAASDLVLNGQKAMLLGIEPPEFPGSDEISWKVPALLVLKLLVHFEHSEPRIMYWIIGLDRHVFKRDNSGILALLNGLNDREQYANIDS